MSATLLDGKKAAEQIRAQLKQRVAAMPKKPGLAAILVGNNPASRVYVGIKRKTCDEVGIYSELHELPEQTTEEALIALIETLNRDKNIHAILLQLPIPPHISEERVLARIAAEKDADGFHAVHLGRLLRGEAEIVACTPQGIMTLLDMNDIDVAGKHAVIVGRSITVGKPLALLMLQKNATVTVCHSKTKNLAALTRQADILVAAVGRAGLITADMVRQGAVVIDVGTNKVDGKMCGDVVFDEVSKKAGAISPVPGGVGPMTVATLLQNTVALAERAQ